MVDETSHICWLLLDLLSFWRPKFWHGLRRNFIGLSGLLAQLPLDDAPERWGWYGGLNVPKSPLLCQVLASSLRRDCRQAAASLFLKWGLERHSVSPVWLHLELLRRLQPQTAPLTWEGGSFQPPFPHVAMLPPLPLSLD